MKNVSLRDLEKLQEKLERLQDQADKVCNFIERKLGTTLEVANEEAEYKNELYAELLAIKGSIEGAIENVYNG